MVFLTPIGLVLSTVLYKATTFPIFSDVKMFVYFRKIREYIYTAQSSHGVQM